MRLILAVFKLRGRYFPSECIFGRICCNMQLGLKKEKKEKKGNGNIFWMIMALAVIARLLVLKRCELS